MKSEIVYRIYHPSKALYLNGWNRNAVAAYWSEGDDFILEFGNTDEEYEQAKALAKKVGGEVEEVRK
jgi:hypothetical protein